MNKKQQYTSIITILLVIILLLGISFWHLNVGVMRNLTYNLRDIQYRLDGMEDVLANDSLSKNEQDEKIKTLSRDAFVAVQNVNAIAEESILYRGYQMSNAESFFLDLVTDPGLINNSRIKEKLLDTSQLLKFNLETERGYDYNLIVDKNHIKKTIASSEERLK